MGQEIRDSQNFEPTFFKQNERVGRIGLIFCVEKNQVSHDVFHLFIGISSEATDTGTSSVFNSFYNICNIKSKYQHQYLHLKMSTRKEI